MNYNADEIELLCFYRRSISLRNKLISLKVIVSELSVT